MLTFRSEVFPDFFKNKISYKDKITFIGSCFTENIGKKLENLKFRVLINPFGILYNPFSVANCLSLCLNPLEFTEKDLVFYNEKWISFLHHGRYSSMNKDEVLNAMNKDLLLGKSYLAESSVLFLTFGSSWVYKYKKTNQIVSNCHKMPSIEFEHFCLSVSEIVDKFSPVLAEIKKLNPDIHVVFTVSPVRHWKDGPVNNQLSKSVLILAVHALVKKFSFVSYFPSYEIMMDDLRDYRFYADDLFHPNQLGIDYIWLKFRNSFISEESVKISEKIDKLNKALAHKPFYPNTLAYKGFIDKNLKLIKELEPLLPGILFKEEFELLLSEKGKYFS